MGVPDLWAEQDAVLDKATEIVERGGAAVIEPDGRVRAVPLPPAGLEREQFLQKELGGAWNSVNPTRSAWLHRPGRSMACRSDASDADPLNPYAVRLTIGARGRVVLFDRE